MKAAFLIVASSFVATAALAQPSITNRDAKAYHLEMSCDDLESGQTVGPGGTVTFDDYEVGKGCTLGVYPNENPWGKDGYPDPKKRLSSAKLKKDSECVIEKHRVVCE